MELATFEFYKELFTAVKRNEETKSKVKTPLIKFGVTFILGIIFVLMANFSKYSAQLYVFAVLDFYFILSYLLKTCAPMRPTARKVREEVKSRRQTRAYYKKLSKGRQPHRSRYLPDVPEGPDAEFLELQLPSETTSVDGLDPQESGSVPEFDSILPTYEETVSQIQSLSDLPTYEAALAENALSDPGHFSASAPLKQYGSISSLPTFVAATAKMLQQLSGKQASSVRPNDSASNSSLPTYEDALAENVLPHSSGSGYASVPRKVFGSTCSLPTHETTVAEIHPFPPSVPPSDSTISLPSDEEVFLPHSLGSRSDSVPSFDMWYPYQFTNE